MKHALPLLALALLLAATPAYSQKKKSTGPKPLRGLYITVDAGLLIPSDKQADFYSGRPECPNSLMRVLHSEQYGTQIWNSLVEQGAISPSAIPSYRAFNVDEYASMYFKLTYQLGVGFRNVGSSGWGWLARFDFSQLTAAGQFLLSSNNGTGILGSDRYVRCDIFGLEKRIFIDLGIAKRIPLTETLDFEFNVGFDVNNTKVSENAIRIAGHTYSILDVWNGETPYPGIGTYEYINDGAMGIGAFGTVALSWRVPMGAIDFGYTCYNIQTKYRRYNENDCYALQHNFLFRFNLNNFKLFD